MAWPWTDGYFLITSEVVGFHSYLLKLSSSHSFKIFFKVTFSLREEKCSHNDFFKNKFKKNNFWMIENLELTCEHWDKKGWLGSVFFKGKKKITVSIERDDFFDDLLGLDIL